MDTSVWSEHLRHTSRRLVRLLEDRAVLVHPWVIGELALGPGAMMNVVASLRVLPQARVAPDGDILEFIDLHRLRGIGWVDAQLLVSALESRSPIWTLDRKLRAAATRFEIADRT